ncbi:peptidoglycan-binding domain-containing protein [Rathayibacter sp. Leaf248]|uniref:peptidoglycan-binding domain-containing protein n=1 Tax=Rathayibacter sp. Leaf248 TaxID=2876555 RepID=UPI001E527F1F|nr:peptidoglycan-binding domain-containing protein [Rathayibacter sp. Leaf248]
MAIKGRLRSLPLVGAATLAVLGVGAITGWALHTALVPPSAPDTSETYTTVELTVGEVSASMNLNAAARWRESEKIVNQATGIVTSVEIGQAEQIEQGKVLYKVNLRPVVAAQGRTPMFRPLALNTEGDDALALQRMLADLGFYSGQQDGNIGPKTEKAIKALQKSLGITQDGVVQPSDIVFFPDIASRVSIDASLVYRGASVVGGEPAITTLEPQPTFTLPVSAEQAQNIEDGTEVTIEGGSGWIAQVAGRDNADDGVVLHLTGETGICGTECSTVALSGESLLPAKVVTQPAVQGTLVPSAALVSLADGSVAVTDSAGETIPVRVKATAQGMSAVDGVREGTLVRIPSSVSRSGG